MAYSATLNGDVFFSTDSIDQALGLGSASLELKAGSAGLFTFTVLPNNVKYDQFHLLTDYVDVYRNEKLIFSGRVSSVKQSFNLTMKIEAQGLLTVLNDSIFRPITHEGTLYQLLNLIISSHNTQVETDKQITLGTVQIPDAACYREYENYESSYSRLSDLVDSFGGYLSIRKESNGLYLDWTRPTAQCSQTIDFGENLIDVEKNSNTDDYISVLIPLGAQIEDEDTGVRSRVTIESVNSGKDYIYLPNVDHKVVAVKMWDDVTEPSNLLRKGQEWLELQGILKTTIELTAIDLANVGYNVGHFKIGMTIGVTSAPHNLDGTPFECVTLSLNLLDPSDDQLSLGGVVEGFTIKAQKEALLNTRIIEKIDSNYTTNKRLNEIKTLLSQDIQESYTLIEQNADNINILAQQVTTTAHIFYEKPVPPYTKGDMWYTSDIGGAAAIAGYAIVGFAVPSVIDGLYICRTSRTAEQSFNFDDWEPVYGYEVSQLSNLRTRVSTAEINISAATSSIDLLTSNVDTLTGEFESAEIRLSAAERNITLKVDATDYNAAQIALMINNAGSTVAIQADHIKLEGIVTANSYFKINTDGSMEATAGYIGGFIIDDVSIRSSTLTDNSAGSIALSKTDFSRIMSTATSYYDDAIAGLRFAIGSKFAIVKNGSVYCSELHIGGMTLTTSDMTSPVRYGNIICNGFKLYGGPNYTRSGENLGYFTSQIGGTGSSHYLRFGMTAPGVDNVIVFGVTTQGRAYSNDGFEGPSNVLGGFRIHKSSTERYIRINESGFTSVDLKSVSTSASSASTILSLVGGLIYGTKAGQLGCVTLVQTSDRRLKTNIKELDIDESADFVYSLVPYSFSFIADAGVTHHGFMADQVQHVNNRKWDVVQDCAVAQKSYKTVAYTDIIADLVATVQSLNKRLSALEGGR